MNSRIYIEGVFLNLDNVTYIQWNSKSTKAIVGFSNGSQTEIWGYGSQVLGAKLRQEYGINLEELEKQINDRKWPEVAAELKKDVCSNG